MKTNIKIDQIKLQTFPSRMNTVNSFYQASSLPLYLVPVGGEQVLGELVAGVEGGVVAEAAGSRRQQQLHQQAAQRPQVPRQQRSAGVRGRTRLGM